jgi:very-short-patch-repair endonuclease
MTLQHSQDFARALRRHQTSAEQKLWMALRKRRLGIWRFNRQVSVGPYTVDFLCREKMLVIEVDGATHGEKHEVDYDQRRTDFLAAKGFHVYRVQNIDVYENLDGVLEGLMLLLDKLPSRYRRAPSPLRGAPPTS